MCFSEVTLLPSLNFTLISHLEILQQSRTKGDQEDSNSTGTSEFLLTLIFGAKVVARVSSHKIVNEVD